MSISGAVSSQISTINGYATSAIAAANAALAVLQALDLPYSSRTYFSGGGITSQHASGGDLPSELPSISLGDEPDVLPIEIPTDKPIKPTFSYPSIPDLLAIVLPPPPDIEIPELNITLPVYHISDPVNFSFTVLDVDIRNEELIKAAVDRLKNNILYGGTGLTEAVENAIWQRGKEREEQELENATDKIITMWAKKGFSLPDGPLAHSLAEAQKDFMNRNIDRVREIAIKQAELEQTNVFKSLDMAVSLAGTLVDMLLKNAELGLKAQTETARFANEYIELQVKTYGIEIEGYKAQAQVYAEQIRANLAMCEVYKAQLEGEIAKGQINEQNVKVYAEQLRAIEVMMDVYKTEVQAMTAFLDAEKTKIEANKLQFDAWAQKMEMIIAKYNGEIELYKATGQLSIADAELAMKGQEAEMRLSIGVMEANNRSAEVEERALISKAQMAMEAARGVAIATGSMAAGAMAAASASSSQQVTQTVT